MVVSLVLILSLLFFALGSHLLRHFLVPRPAESLNGEYSRTAHKIGRTYKILATMALVAAWAWVLVESLLILLKTNPFE